MKEAIAVVLMLFGGPDGLKESEAVIVRDLPGKTYDKNDCIKGCTFSFNDVFTGQRR